MSHSDRLEKNMVEYLVIGAGVVGGMVARALCRYTNSVAIVEKCSDVAMGATRANSAIVHAGFDCKVGTLKAKLNVMGSKMMPEVAHALGVKYNPCGSLVVGFSDEDRATLEELKVRGETNGVEGLVVLDREGVLALEENIGDDVTCALYAPTGAIICPYELAIAAVGCAMDNGAELYLGFEVAKVTPVMDGARVRFYEVESRDGRKIEAHTVINCAGVYADEVYQTLDGEKTMDFSIHPRVGEYLLLDKEYGKTVSRTIFRCPSKMGKGILVTPTVDGNLLLGPTAVDTVDKSDTQVTPEGIAKVTKQATEQVKVNLRGAVITSFAGLRAVGSSGDFIIDYGHERFLNVAGIESPGLSASPAIAEYVIELLQKKMGRDAFVVRTEYTPNYLSLAWLFHEMNDDEKCAVIAKNSAFANMICRCEEITEGEIVAAIHRDPKPHDVDGIKRRTRASMGRCQGGFCVPVIVGILARELGVPEEEITKFGGNSYMLVGKTKTGEEA